MKKSLAYIIIGSVLNILFNADALCQMPGNLDLNFGTDGKVMLPAPDAAIGYAMVIQPDGKLIVVGDRQDNSPNADDLDHTVIRFMPDGSLDNTFGNGGIVITELDTLVTSIAAVALEPITGKVVGAGFAEVAGQNGDPSTTHIFLFRYNSDGTTDNSFGTNGSVIQVVDAYSLANSVIIDPNGKILVGAYSNQGFIALRFNNDGTPDLTFNGTGLTATEFIGYQLPRTTSMLLQTDGKVIVGGSVRDAANSNRRDFVLVRLNPDGTADSGFGTNGVVHTISGATNESIGALALQTDGKIVATGTRGDISGSAPQNIIIARYNTDGSVDAGFGTAGVVIDGFTATDLSGASAVVLQADGKIIVGGRSYSGSLAAPIDADFAVARFLATGAVDAGFGNNGKVTTTINTNGAYESVRSMKLQQDGRLVVAGLSDGKFALARYLTEPSPAGLNEFSTVINDVAVFPNPATDKLTVSYSLAQESEVAVHICDVSGRYIAPLTVPFSETAGKHEQIIQLPEALETGCYYVVLTAGSHQQTQKIVVSK